MKLLLTSGGITNASIKKAFFELVGKAPEDISLVVIPTAVNVENGHKGWFIDNLTQLNNLGLKSIEIADISAVPEKVWRPRLEQADVIFMGGGNTFYLMEWLNKTNLSHSLRDLLATKVYVGVSAGGVVTNPDLWLRLSQVLYGDDLDRTENIEGLGFVDFYFLPHLNSLHFKQLRKVNIEASLAGVSKKVYALDDQSALKIVDGKLEVITEGEYAEFN